jgi:hypothetical protein
VVESLKQIVGFGVPNSMVIAASDLLIMVAVASRHLIAFLAATLLTSVGCLLLILPDLTTFILAVGAMLGSLLIAIAGMHSRRGRAALDQKLEHLRRDIAQLNCAESSRLMRAITSATTQSPEIIRGEPQLKKSKARSRPSAEPPPVPANVTPEVGLDPSSGRPLPAIGSAPTQPSQPEELKIEKRKARPRRSEAKPNTLKEDDRLHETSTRQGGRTESPSPPSALAEGAAPAGKGQDRAGSEGV